MDNMRGIALMVAAMALFAVEDMFLKLSAETMPIGQILAAGGLFGAICFGAVARMRGEPLFARGVWTGAVGWRNLGEMVASGFYVTALALLPLSTVSAILQAQPLAITCCAALFLGEQVGWRRWTAIGVGFVGILFVVQPGREFEVHSLLAVAAVAGLTLRDLATRGVPRRIGSSAIGFSAMTMMLLLGAAMMAVQGTAPLDRPSALVLLGALVAGTAGYALIVAATRVGEVSVVTPFRYARLVFVLVLALIVFGEVPAPAVIFGATLVIASGLYTLARERRRRGRADPSRIAHFSRIPTND
ncbi:DMT family transporter [Falsirhodobacter halotolerans]|uniref:DMT family transporter n=1 Tax=Falsirhodobacter halotolerans TaxID=1146892 RepID=UPI001FD194B2|nr:DMT family transporter [Falsirhodobacter halotolerans]MCJ8140413.1 DMT family transporter [Falsirhodobacter halotolerans]